MAPDRRIQHTAPSRLLRGSFMNDYNVHARHIINDYNAYARRITNDYNVHARHITNDYNAYARRITNNDVIDDIVTYSKVWLDQFLGCKRVNVKLCGWVPSFNWTSDTTFYIYIETSYEVTWV